MGHIRTDYFFFILKFKLYNFFTTLTQSGFNVLHWARSTIGHCLKRCLEFCSKNVPRSEPFNIALINYMTETRHHPVNKTVLPRFWSHVHFTSIRRDTCTHATDILSPLLSVNHNSWYALPTSYSVYSSWSPFFALDRSGLNSFFITV